MKGENVVISNTKNVTFYQVSRVFPQELSSMFSNNIYIFSCSLGGGLKWNLKF